MLVRNLLIILFFALSLGCSSSSDESTESDDVGTSSTDGDTEIDGSDTADVDEPSPDTKDEPDSQDEPDVTDEPDTKEEPEVEVVEPEYGAIAGKLVNAAGESVGLAYLLICDAGGCTSAQADPNGEFLVEDLEVGEYKVQVLADDMGYMNMEYPLVVEADKTVSAGEDIVLVETQGAPVAWDPAQGGSVVLADGSLTLSIAPGDLKFPLGLKKEIWAAVVPGQYLPPFGDEPWTDDSELYAFHINPLGVISKGASFGLSVTAAADSKATSFTVWAVHADTGKLQPAGTVSKGEDGLIVSGDELELHELTTLILVGQAASQ